MEKFNKVLLALAEIAVYILMGVMLIYLPVILAEKTAQLAVSHPAWRGMDGWIRLGGFIISIGLIACTFDFCVRIAYYLVLIGFIFSPWVELLMAYGLGLGNTEEAFELICLSLFSALCARIMIVADDRMRSIYGDRYWKFPSTFKKLNYE